MTGQLSPDSADAESIRVFGVGLGLALLIALYVIALLVIFALSSHPNCCLIGTGIVVILTIITLFMVLSTEPWSASTEETGPEITSSFYTKRIIFTLIFVAGFAGSVVGVLLLDILPERQAVKPEEFRLLALPPNLRTVLPADEAPASPMRGSGDGEGSTVSYTTG